jgi:rhamnose utilization protein RhaD (predicted bifunctional aldolase and dehydrogenase)
MGVLAQRPAFGGVKSPAQPAEERAAAAARLMPRLRALMSEQQAKIGHFSDDAEALEFVGSRDFERLAAIGTSCPDHFLRTKIAPLTLDSARLDDAAYLAQSVNAYRERYAAYYHAAVPAGDPAMRDANPVVVLVPRRRRHYLRRGQDDRRLAGEFYGNAINVMRWRRSDRRLHRPR